MIRIRRGLDVPVLGAPVQAIEEGPAISQVAVSGEDYVGLRPRMAVAVGDRVRTGQLLFADKRNESARFTAPGCGEVVAIERGEKRRLLAVVVRLEGDECEEFVGDVRDVLVRSGLWTALRARPFGHVPPPDPKPRSIFVTAMDTSPLGADPACVLAGREGDFESGLRALAQLTDGPVRLCRRPGAAIPAGGAEVHEFAGPHPAGLPGTHIHFLDPAGPDRVVWHIGYQDVAAIGALLRTGRLSTERVIALGGPMVARPSLLRTRIGASLRELLAGRLREGAQRVISGSVLSGRVGSFLGRYHTQVAVLAGAPPRVRPRAVVPTGAYERVMPLDIEPTALVKALLVGDVEGAIELGCLELEEEDLALCSYVCPSGSDFGEPLRAVLNGIEAEA